MGSGVLSPKHQNGNLAILTRYRWSYKGFEQLEVRQLAPSWSERMVSPCHRQIQAYVSARFVQTEDCAARCLENAGSLAYRATRMVQKSCEIFESRRYSYGMV